MSADEWYRIQKQVEMVMRFRPDNASGTDTKEKAEREKAE